MQNNVLQRECVATWVEIYRIITEKHKYLFTDVSNDAQYFKNSEMDDAFLRWLSF